MKKEDIVKNPQIRVLEDLKIRNISNEKTIAGEYYGSKFNYNQTFKMFNDYKKAFLSLDGVNREPITISAPTTIASVNAFYGSIDSNKIANMTGPGFLFEYTEKYTREIGSKTVFILDLFLNEEFINKLHKAGVKNVIITKITDYMHPIVKFFGKKKGLIDDKDFLDEYIKSGKKLPTNMQFIRLIDFAKTGSKIKEDIEFPYKEDQIAAYFLTGATTSRYPKGVKIYVDGFTKMSQIYDNMWFDFTKADRNTVFIPIFYATGAIHGVHAGLFSGATNIYKPKYDRFAFAQDLIDSKAKIALVAPSHLATLKNADLKDKSLSHVKYIFIGGEAIMPSQMKQFRRNAKRLGIENVLNGYGMTETGSMTAMSEPIPLSEDDVTVVPVHGVQYRVVDSKTGDILPDNIRGIIQKKSPCATAGYIDDSKDKTLFTEDGWINTGDVGIRYSDGRYRIFGRFTDKFINNGIEYPMFDIEEKVLEHEGVLEAEVIKFEINNNEYPVIVIVLTKEWEDKLDLVVKDLSLLDVAGIEYLIGTRFIDSFKTNEVTAKRDILSLQEDKNGYYKFNAEENLFYQTDLENGNQIQEYPISSNELKISLLEKVMCLSLKK
ncbi:MAG: class I adenylate-forming enzyme family protein [Clostridia bacterium]|nr:class I adenylate-forming enzyme family protein [Clostridia bacterium]